MPFNFPHDLWRHSVQDYLDGKPLIEVLTVQSFADILRLLPPGRQRVLLIDKRGNQLTDRAVTSLRHKNGDGVQLPVDSLLLFMKLPLIGSCPERSELIALALVDMTLEAKNPGTFVFGRTDMVSPFMALPWLPWKLLILGNVQSTLWP